MRYLPDGVRWLIALSLLVNVFALGSNRALTDHEVHLAATARQMVVSGDWLVPRIGDRTWLEKPPLPQWLAAGTAVFLGRFDEWTMRLPFALCGVAVVLLAAQIATMLFGPRVGFVSGCIQATCVYQVTYSRLAESDVLLQCFVLGAIAVFLAREMRLTSPDLGRGWFWALLGAMNLSKGLAFGAVLTLLTCAGWGLFGEPGASATGVRLWRLAKRWWSLPGVLLALLIAGAWPMAVILREPEALALWQSHLFGRAAGSLGYTQPWWYYLTTWPVQLLPWTPFLFVPFFIRADRREKGLSNPPEPNPQGSDESRKLFCLWWALSQAAVLSLSSGKHHHYLIYALPGLSPLMALGVLRCGTALEGTLLRSVANWRAVMGVVIAGHLIVQAAIMPLRDPSRCDREFLAAVDRVAEADVPLVACGSQEISRHLFYVQRPIAGIWSVADVPVAVPGARRVYIIARGHARTALEEQWGDVQQIAQSQFTRRERTPDDRYTLFLVHRDMRTAPSLTVGADYWKR
jgi:4-amino-4-deoxy-L-arabinose transferase-like glycosyltransferase